MTKRELYIEIVKHYPHTVDVRRLSFDLGFKKLQGLQSIVRHMRDAGVDIQLRPATPAYKKEFTYDFVQELNKEIKRSK